MVASALSISELTALVRMTSACENFSTGSATWVTKEERANAQR